MKNPFRFLSPFAWQCIAWIAVLLFCGWFAIWGIK